ncbi:MAG: alpha/beta hydrolase [Firmicutes bacterium]|nr:alpha/beta hydrolase [Bacillota bacterium]
MKTILLLHGWGGNENSFAPILPYLSKHFRCLAPAFPMFGCDSDNQPDTPWTLDDYTNFIQEYLVTNNVEKCHILAHSFGARVTALLVTRNPARFEKLVLTGAAGIRRRKFSTIIKIKLYKLRKKLGYKKQSGSPDYKKLTNSGKKTFQNIINRDLKSEIKQINNPTLLIFGRNDNATPVKLGKKWVKISQNANLLVYNNSGHFAYLDETSRFIKDTCEFFLD